jgi:hypothetical protein
MDWSALLADTNVLARNAAVPLPVALSLSAFASNQTDSRVFGEALAIAEDVPPELTQGADKLRYAAWARAHFGSRALSLGWQPRADEDADTQRLRRTLLPFVADRGRNPALAREARVRAARWPQDPKVVPEGVRSELLYTAAHTAEHDDAALYAHLVATAKSVSVAAERRDVLKALGGFRDPAVARQAAELMLTGPFAAQEALLILKAQLENESTRVHALAWIEANYEALLARGARESFRRLPEWAGGGCSAEERTRFVTAFAQRMQKIDGGPRSYTKALESIDLCIAYRRTQEAALSAWLKAGARQR